MWRFPHTPFKAKRSKRAFGWTCDETRASTDVYAHEMSDEDHRRLLQLVTAVEGKVVLSGYPSDLYESMLLAPRWYRVEFNLLNNAAGGSTKRRETECVWTNFGPTGAMA